MLRIDTNTPTSSQALPPKAFLDTDDITPNACARNGQTPPVVRECPDRPSLLMQAKNLSAEISLQVNYALFKAAVRVGSTRFANHFLDMGVIKALKDSTAGAAQVFMHAARRGNVELVKRILEKDDDTGTIATQLASVLPELLTHGHQVQFMKLLCLIRERKPAVLSESTLQSLIYVAAKNNATDTVELLSRFALQCHPKISAYDIFDVVSRLDRNEQLQALFNGGLVLNEAEKRRLTDSNSRYSKETKTLIRNGIPNIDDAINNGNVDRVRQYINQCGETGLKDHKNSGRWLFNAAATGNKTIFSMLFEAGAPCNYVSRSHSTALMLLSQNGYTDLVLKVLEKYEGKESINKQNPTGVTPLIAAVYKGHLHVARILLAKNADVSMKTAHGKTAIHFAIENWHEEMIMELFKHYKPSIAEAQELLNLAIETEQYRIIEIVARSLLKVLAKPIHAYKAFKKLIDEDSDLSMFHALLDAGLKLTEDQIAVLFEDEELASQIRNYKRPQSAFILDAFQDGRVADFDDMEFPYWMHDLEEESLDIDPDVHEQLHSVKAFLDSLPPLRVSDDVKEYFDGWHPAVVLALQATQIDETESVERLVDLLLKPELGLKLIDSSGAAIKNIDESIKSRLRDQFFSIAVSQNSMLRELIREECPAPPSEQDDEKTRNKIENRRAAWFQAQAFVQVENHLPFRLQMRNQSDIQPIKQAVAKIRRAARNAPQEKDQSKIEAIKNKLTETHLAVEETLDTINKGADMPESQSNELAKALDSELPDTLRYWLGDQLFVQRKKALEAAQATIKEVKAKLKKCSESVPT